eukprot:4631446-Pyramimonas_sp.AAC.1
MRARPELALRRDRRALVEVAAIGRIRERWGDGDPSSRGDLAPRSPAPMGSASGHSRSVAACGR